MIRESLPPRALPSLLLCLLTACGEAALPVPECFVHGSCPEPASRCQVASCRANHCGADPLPAGTVVDGSLHCGRVVCDDAGQEVVQYDPLNCATTLASVTSSSPSFLSVAGGQSVTLTGSNLQATSVYLNDASCSFVARDDGTSLTFTTPAYLPATTSNLLAITNVRGTSLYPALASVYAHGPDLPPLVADGLAQDWDYRFVAATGGDAADPALLHTLSVAYDDQGLWLFVEGGSTSLPGNALVVYLDAQYGVAGHPGVQDLRLLTDSTGALDDACTADLVVTDPAFQAQFCAGTVGLASVALGQGAPATDAAGLRLLGALADPAVLDWGLDVGGGSTIAVAAWSPVAVGVELQLPWSALGLAAPPVGSTIGIFVREVAPGGVPLAGQALPRDAAAPPTVSAVLPVQIL